MRQEMKKHDTKEMYDFKQEVETIIMQLERIKGEIDFSFEHERNADYDYITSKLLSAITFTTWAVETIQKQRIKVQNVD